ncbi:protein kinase domain protein, partial [Ichthyophthirius multifiliis]
QVKEKQIGDYSFLLNDKIGSGSFGKVYKGKNTNTQQKVAIKVLDKNEICMSEYLLQGLIMEIKILRKLKSEYIVQLTDVLETPNNFYLIQELCEGDLRKILKQKKLLPEQQAIKIIQQVLKGFMELQINGIIHRDLKPENILISNDIYKLADFGLSKTVDNFQRQLMISQVGTPLYMSPQILMKEKYTSKCDLWSLGFIFYEIIYGRTPFTGKSQYLLIQDFQNNKVVFDQGIQCSDKCQDFILNCLKIQESQRFEWINAYKHDLFKLEFQNEIIQFNEMENKSNMIINELRQFIYKNKIDIEYVFKQMDTSKDAIIDINEFSKLIQQFDESITRLEIEYIFNKYDIDQNNFITFTEFSKCILENQKTNKQIVQKTFYRYNFN